MVLYDIFVEWYTLCVDQNDTINTALDTAEKSVDNFKLQILEKAGISFEKIIKEFKATGFANIKDYFDVAEGGELSFKPFDKLSRKKASAIRKIKEKTVITESKDGEQVYKTSTVEIELWDKHTALWRLIELRGDKPAEKQEHTGNVTVTIIDYSKVAND